MSKVPLLLGSGCVKRIPLSGKRRKSSVVLWLDELGLRSQHTAGKSYAPKGETPVLKKTGDRFYLTEIAAIGNHGQLLFMVVEGNFNGEVFVRFLQKLLKSFDRKVFLIADHHPVHLGNKAVHGWPGTTSK